MIVLMQVQETPSNYGRILKEKLYFSLKPLTQTWTQLKMPHATIQNLKKYKPEIVSQFLSCKKLKVYTLSQFKNFLLNGLANISQLSPSVSIVQSTHKLWTSGCNLVPSRCLTILNSSVFNAKTLYYNVLTNMNYMRAPHSIKTQERCTSNARIGLKPFQKALFFFQT